MALATVVRSPAIARMSPTSAPKCARSFGSRRAMPRPTSLPRASAMRRDTGAAVASRAGVSIFLGSLITALLEPPPGVGPERQAVDQLSNVELSIEKRVYAMKQPEEKDPGLTFFEGGFDATSDEGIAPAQDFLAFSLELLGGRVGLALLRGPDQALDAPVFSHHELRVLRAHERGTAFHQLGEQLVV